MNKHIMLVMKWLDNKDSVSQEELEENRRISAAAWEAYAARAAWAAAYAYHADAAYWLGKYFEITGEDKNEYVKELSK